MMNDTHVRDQIHHAFDTRLSGMTGDPWLAQRIVGAEGRLKVKKKLSVGFVLIMILVLAVVGAVAAVILSLQQIVEEQAIPMANQYEDERYTVEDTNILLQLAEENGIVLSEQTKEQIQRALAQGEGYFKEELLMAFAKAEFGESPSAWTLEEQKWFDDVCVAIGFIPEGEKALPANGDDAKHQIIQTASEYVRETYGAEASLADPTRYEVGVQYINGDTDGVYSGLYWSIHYQPQTLEDNEYWVYLNDQGEILAVSYTHLTLPTTTRV